MLFSSSKYHDSEDVKKREKKPVQTVDLVLLMIQHNTIQHNTTQHNTIQKQFIDRINNAYIGKKILIK